jgi:TRAP-type mannitol/chloroaromatic compound transport system substrate-binding protein
VQVRRLPDDVLARLREASLEVVAEVAASDELAGRIYASYSQFFEDAKAYSAISEQAYINAR